MRSISAVSSVSSLLEIHHVHFYSISNGIASVPRRLGSACTNAQADMCHRFPQLHRSWNHCKKVSFSGDAQADLCHRCPQMHRSWNYCKNISLFGGAFSFGGALTIPISPCFFINIFTLVIRTVSSYYTCPKKWTSPFEYQLMWLNAVGWVANSVDPDQTPRAVSDLGLHCLLMPFLSEYLVKIR